MATISILSIARNRGDSRRQQRDWLVWADLRRTWMRGESHLSSRRHYALGRKSVERRRRGCQWQWASAQWALSRAGGGRRARGHGGCQSKGFVGWLEADGLRRRWHAGAKQGEGDAVVCKRLPATWSGQGVLDGACWTGRAACWVLGAGQADAGRVCSQALVHGAAGEEAPSW